jgi:hypothetical protein
MIDRRTPGYRAARDSAEDARVRVLELLDEWFSMPTETPVGLLLIAEDAGVGSKPVLLFAEPDEPTGGLTRGQQRELVEQVENASLQQVLMYHGLWEGHLATRPNDEAWELYAGTDNNAEIAHEGKTVQREVTADEAFAELVSWMAPWGQEGWRDDYVANAAEAKRLDLKMREESVRSVYEGHGATVDITKTLRGDVHSVQVQGRATSKGLSVLSKIEQAIQKVADKSGESISSRGRSGDWVYWWTDGPLTAALMQALGHAGMQPNAARRRKLHPGVKPWRVELSSAPNPDIEGGYWQGGMPGRPRSVPVASFAEASQVVQDYIAQHELGGGNWTGGEITDYATGKVLGRVSYNGRVWPPGEWSADQQALWPREDR